MAVVKRYNLNKFYFSDRLTEKLESICESNLTVVEAPTGFGKTTSVRNFLNNVDEPVLWMTIENDDREYFFEEICNHIHNIDSVIAGKLRAVGCPEDLEMSNKIANILSELDLSEKYIVVFDNFQYISNTIIGKTILKLLDVFEDSVRFVVLTQTVKSAPMIDLIFNNRINYIGKSDLEFNHEEIKMYFRECGIKLDDSEVDYLFRYTEGWISAIYLQMLHYLSNNEFEPDAGIDKLVCKAIWDKISIEEQDFLISISIYDSFSLKQALFIGGDELTADEIKKLLKSNSFIRYDSKDRKYFTHSILRYYLKSEFDKLDIIVKKRVYEKAAKWYEENENYYQALEYYYKIRKYDDIYYMSNSLDDIVPHLTKDNKNMFLQIVSGVSLETKEQNLRRSIIFAFVLFIYNEKDFFNKECEIITEMIDNSKYLRQREKDILHGEVMFINSFGKYNDLNKMYDMYVKSYEYMQSPSSIYSDKISIIFKNPSVLGCFHSKSGEAVKELENFEKTMIYYYKLTAGNSKGLEAVMRAEILFNQGNFQDAELLCQKALYMAETRGQVNVYICTMFLMVRISGFQGDYDNIKYNFQSIRKKIENTGENDKSFMADLCEGYMYMLIGKPSSIPNWLKDEKSIEVRCPILPLVMANIIYARYLISNNEYSKFLGISGQMLGSTKVYNNILFEIYLYIFIAHANYKLGNKVKAVKFLNEAVDIAKNDKFIIPFVENYSLIEDIYEADAKHQDRIDFMNDVIACHRKYDRKFKSVQNSYREDMDYGLTNRELQIAKLAADRLSNKEIADQLYIAVGTVKSNLKTIFSKLQIKSRSELKNFFD